MLLCMLVSKMTGLKILCVVDLPYSQLKTLSTNILPSKASLMIYHAIISRHPQTIYVICHIPDNGRMLSAMRWGLLPPWMKQQPKPSPGFINARLETITQKPAFRHAIKRHRCLVIANGFYEWQKTANNKQPFFIHLNNHQLFAMAGIWERYIDEDGVSMETCAIITTSANAALAHIHDRMPVIISKTNYDTWLINHDEDRLTHALACIAEELPSEQIQMHPVAKNIEMVSSLDMRQVP